MLVIRCKNCNTELESHPTQARSCGCSNMTMVQNDKISAIDLSQVLIISGAEKNKAKYNTLFTPEELAYQEARRKRKVRKLEFEIR